MDDYSWFIGIIEGEGYFGIHKPKNSPEFSIAMCDLDIMEKIAKMVDGKINSFTPKGKTVKNTPYKKQHKIQLHGRKAFALMEGVEPYLSERRKEQIKGVREAYRPKTTFTTEGYVSRKKPINIPILKTQA